MVSVTRCLAIVACVLVSSTLRAQWEVDGPNAVLRIDGQRASLVDPAAHDVRVPAPGTLRLSVESGNNPFMPLILAASVIDPTGVAVLQAPGLGILNIGVGSLPLPTAIVILGDGIGRTQNPTIDALFVTGSAATTAPTFTFIQSIPPSCQLRLAFQAVVADPTAGALPLDMTEAADAVIREGFSNVLIHGAQQSSFVPFGNGYSFRFHGVSHTGVWVSRCGFVTFGAPTSLISGGSSIDARSFVASEPAIAAWLGDWNPQAFGPNDGVFVERAGNEMWIEWGYTRGMPSGAPGIAHTGDVDFNRFGIRLVLTPGTQTSCPANDPVFGAFDIHVGRADPSSSVDAGQGLLGHTPGSFSALSFAVDGDFQRSSTAPVGVPQLEEHDTGFRNLSDIGHNGLGTPRHFADMRSWDSRSVMFRPVSASSPGGPGYMIVPPTATPPDMFLGSTPRTWDVAGGETVTLVGKFRGFSNATSQGSVRVVGSQGTQTTVNVLGVIDGSGLASPIFVPSQPDPAFRDAEGLVITTPPLSTLTPPLSIEVTFASGTVISRPLGTWNGSPIEVTPALDERIFRYRIRGQPILYYGQSYTEFFVSENGVVSFATPQRDFAPTTASVYTPLPIDPPNPMVAAYYTDLSPPLVGSNATVSISENFATSSVSIVWSGLVYYTTLTPCGTFSIAILGDSVRFDHSQVLGAPFFVGNPQVIAGVSDQGPGQDLNILGFPMTIPTAPGTSMLRGALINSAVVPSSYGAMGVWHLQDIASIGSWVIF